MSRRHPICGLSIYGVIFVNALMHLGGAMHAGYNPGALTALILYPSEFIVGGKSLLWKTDATVWALV